MHGLQFAKLPMVLIRQSFLLPTFFTVQYIKISVLKITRYTVTGNLKKMLFRKPFSSVFHPSLQDPVTGYHALIKQKLKIRQCLYDKAK